MWKREGVTIKRTGKGLVMIQNMLDSVVKKNIHPDPTMTRPEKISVTERIRKTGATSVNTPESLPESMESPKIPIKTSINLLFDHLHPLKRGNCYDDPKIV